MQNQWNLWLMDLVAFTTEDLNPALRILGQLHYVM